VFKADGQLQSHLQQDPPCAIQGNRTLQEGFTKDQEKKLRSRKKTHADMTDEDKWCEIYKILFPDDDPSAIPSPCELPSLDPRSSPSDNLPKDYSESDNEGSSRDLNGSGELEDYATFIRREMPALVRRELETLFRGEFQDVEERLRPRIAEIVLDLQPRLLGLYKQSQMPLSEYGPQQHQPRGDTTSGSEPCSTPMLSQSTDPDSGTGPHSTPDVGFELDSLVGDISTATQLGLCGDDFDAVGDTLHPANQTPTQHAENHSGLGLNWDYEFDKWLSPLLYMPTPEEIQDGSSGEGPAAQGG
jgi:hypothetical protein